MWMAVTSRVEEDESDLTLRTETDRNGDPIYPGIGTEVCAIGSYGWNYTGRVISIDTDEGTFTIGGVKADNPRQRRVRKLLEE